MSALAGLAWLETVRTIFIVLATLCLRCYVSATPWPKKEVQTQSFRLNAKSSFTRIVQSAREVRECYLAVAR